VTLVKRHDWAFNGRSAWKSVAERWAKETSEWVGSNYLCYSCDITFANDPWEYQHHEEQYITNHNDKILMNYNASLLHYPTNILPKFLNHVVLLTHLAVHDNTTTTTVLILHSGIGRILVENQSLCLIAFPKVTAVDIVGATRR
jgi:hypothetical protein